MARDLLVDVDIRPLLAASERLAIEVGRGFNESFRRLLVGMLRRAAAITPPASRAAARANAGDAQKRVQLTKRDQDRGLSAIQKDLLAVFSGLGSSGGRKARRASLSDIETIHARLFAKKVPGRPLRSDRPGGDRYVVSEDALNQFRRILEKRVGYSASGWKPGAARLGVRLPAWVNNKEGKGSADIQITGLARRAIITNNTVPPKLEREVNRRLQWGVGAQVRATEREIAWLNARAARRSGIND